MKSFSIKQISEHVNGQVVGDASLIIKNLSQISDAERGHLTFIGSKDYLSQWHKCGATAAIANQSLRNDTKIKDNQAVIFVSNADLAMAKILELYSQALPIHTNIHASAVIDESAKIGQNVSIGPSTYIGKNCVIGDNTVIYANVNIYDDTRIGNDCTIWSGVLIRERTEIGHHCTLHANCSIGNDGFGYRPAEDGQGIVKIPHIGNVVVGNHVDIGASTCIDKGKFSSTKIGHFTKIDNLVQIGHNCVIGKGCIICGAVGMSGSVTLGDGATIAGGAGIKDHVHIGKGASVGARSGVMHDVPDGEKHAGYPADLLTDTMRQWAAVRRLPETTKLVKRLLKKADKP